MQIQRETQVSTTSLLCIWTLNDAGVLNTFESQKYSAPDPNFKSALYDAYRAWMARTPDHVFDSAWLHLGLADDSSAAWYKALQHLSDSFLENRHGRWHLKTDALGAWQQSVLSRMSELPLLAWTQAHTPDATAPTPRGLRPYAAVVSDYLDQHSLHETHVHLNGSTHAQEAWLHALQRPDQSSVDFSKKWQKNARIRDLTRAVDPDLTPVELRKRLRTAKSWRQILMHAAYSDTNWHAQVQESDYDKQADRNTFTTAQELHWQTAFLMRWRQEENSVLGALYHRYVLHMNLYHQLMVQNEDRPGFDQFQKSADIGLREDIEKAYLQRFEDAHGPDTRTSQIRYYEGRFAPKTSVKKLLKLLLDILGGYHTYLRNQLPADEAPNWPKKHHQLLPLLQGLTPLQDYLGRQGIQPLKLALVCHFIKKEWTKTDKQHAPYRHHSLVKTLNQSTQSLLHLLKVYPALGQWIRGIDGAANELHAPPEFFAPTFRNCARHGLTHKTFHAGEDFPHLLSGLRYMLEAIEFLNLRAGDRLGHGTAMGIEPQLWISRMPQTVLVKRGDWFLSLLAAWRLYQMQPTGFEATTAHTITENLAQITVDLFGQLHSPQLCKQAMALRDLDLSLVLRWQSLDPQKAHGMIANDALRQEMAMVANAAKNHREAFDLHWQWQRDRAVWTRSEEYISVAGNFLHAPAYLLLQQTLMKIVADRGIVIETLPSSNVRISQYRSFEEHHALRWMKAPNATHTQDPDILVSLGSDDPGIFATDLATEFHHLFFALQRKGLDETQALRRVAEINERGRIYRFHP
jgi:hypothetical protein